MSLFDRSDADAIDTVLDARQRIDWAGARTALLDWYARVGRKLPWREDLTPYRVWISEIMLQQTTVAAVEGYFVRFTALFPNVEALASASEGEILKAWEGLGYYQRARNLHKAAQAIVRKGGFPADTEGWMALPGVGRSTAGAICSISLGLETPILDANVRRVQRRFLHAMDPGTPGDAVLWDSSERFVRGAGDPGSVNQALMEVGATICLSRLARCTDCPLSGHCVTAVHGLPDALPARKRPDRPVRIRTALVSLGATSIRLRKNEGGRLMEGLWDVLSLPGPPGDLPERIGRSGRNLGTVEHVYSHFREEVHIFELGFGVDPADLVDASRAVEVPLHESDRYPLTGVARKILSLLASLGRREAR